MTQADVIKGMVRAFATGDVTSIESLVHRDYIDYQGLGDTPIRGPQGFRQVVEAARSAYADLDVTIEDLLLDGPKVAARLRWKGKRAEDGATISRETIDILTITEGQAVEHWGVRLWIETE